MAVYGVEHLWRQSDKTRLRGNESPEEADLGPLRRALLSWFKPRCGLKGSADESDEVVGGRCTNTHAGMTADLPEH